MDNATDLPERDEHGRLLVTVSTADGRKYHEYVSEEDLEAADAYYRRLMEEDGAS